MERAEDLTRAGVLLLEAEEEQGEGSNECVIVCKVKIRWVGMWIISFAFGVAFNDEFVVGYVVVQVGRSLLLLLFLLLLLVLALFSLFALLLFLFLLLAEICHLLDTNDRA